MESSKLLPVEKYQIQTRLQEDEVYQRIQNLISYEYLGTLSGNTFKISRNIRYRNSFLPEIKGSVEKLKGKTVVNISMNLKLFVKIFMIIWLSLVGLPSAIILIVLFRRLLFWNFENLSAFLLIPIGMFIFGYLLMLLAFRLEAISSVKTINELLEAEKIIKN